ncbi:hypothetical protein BUALT_Bualt11G0022500 [Buddleja alternifolia]|uniref:CCHC-type domain-containing protein n=1 Tax=Buddleja alternifolia TaxID=168488 RepID=A0AAV6WQX9_9LAMI|nr:hypothetical protein BUALT_Bualt11G0022500 [Buddleja alternifolia]
MFTSYTSGNFGRVRMVNHGVTEVIGMGNINLETDTRCRLILRDVRHIPNIRLNIISTGNLDDDGYVSHFGEGKWKLTKGSLITAKGKKKNSLYLMQAKLSNGESERRESSQEVPDDLDPIPSRTTRDHGGDVQDEQNDITDDEPVDDQVPPIQTDDPVPPPEARVRRSTRQTRPSTRYNPDETEKFMKIMADLNSVRDRLVALEARVQRTEALLGQSLETPMVAIFQKFQGLEERVEKWGKSMDEIPSFIEGRMVSLAEDISILTDAVDMNLDAVNVEISVLKRATGSVVSGDGGPSSKLRVPDPKSFGGERSAKELENFLWDMETYFQVARVSDAEKVSMASWAQAELRRQGVKDLPSTFAAADGLVDFSGIEVRGSETKQRSTGSGVGNFTKGDSKNQETHDEKTPTSANKPQKGCFICGSLDHRMRDCPKRERLNALMEDTNKDASESAEATRLGGLQLLNAIQILDEEDAVGDFEPVNNRM